MTLSLLILWSQVSSALKISHKLLSLNILKYNFLEDGDQEHSFVFPFLGPHTMVLSVYCCICSQRSLLGGFGRFLCGAENITLVDWMQKKKKKNSLPTILSLLLQDIFLHECPGVS